MTTTTLAPNHQILWSLIISKSSFYSKFLKLHHSSLKKLILTPENHLTITGNSFIIGIPPDLYHVNENPITKFEIEKSKMPSNFHHKSVESGSKLGFKRLKDGDGEKSR
eukprot:TRINITY_DN1949_c0_g1_i1.p2 TRINITY_DN1949_c0_g1~~TRINITY_DN1949_c0_g1_i1.p2  ORF type:complete len:109 (+),score=4.46 TRINITY_DN1949_c0_g1_i1:667-993(+)